MPVKASHDELRHAACAFCRAMAVIKPPGLDDVLCDLLNKTNFLGSTWYRHRFPLLCIDTDIYTEYLNHGGLAVYDARHKSYGCDDPDFQFQKIHPRRVDYAKFQAAIAHCERNHPRCRRPAKVRQVAGLRVIDCRTRSVVPSPRRCQYVALSYVWGLSPASSGPGGPAGSFSPVVNDSIRVALALGYQYLWVDRHCIGSDRDRHDMIRQMDQVYSGAALTIVAAAGDDASHGLPGVGGAARATQYETTIGHVGFLEVLPFGPDLLKYTTWASRGWTYQEAYLSPRRLVFAHREVYYFCGTMAVSESINMPFEWAEDNPNAAEVFADFKPPTVERDMRGAVTTWDVFDRIREYTARQLSYDADILDAFRGVLNHFEREHSIHHLWGVPLGLAGHTVSVEYEFCLCWYTLAGPLPRRPGFPSWSWIGWRGPVEYHEGYSRTNYADVGQPNGSGDYQIAAALEGEVRPAVQLLQPRAVDALRRRDRSRADPVRLRIRGRTIPVRYAGISLNRAARNAETAVRAGGGKPERFARTHGALIWFPVAADAYVGIDLHTCAFFDKEVGPADPLLGLVFKISPSRNHSETWHYRILLLQPVGDHWERVGLVNEIMGRDRWGRTHQGRLYVNSRGEVLDRVAVAHSRPPWEWNTVKETIYLE